VNGMTIDCDRLLLHIYSLYLYLDAISKQRKATLSSLVESVRQSVRLSTLKNWAYKRKNFHNILYFKTSKFCLQIQELMNSDRETSNLHEHMFTVMTIPG